MHEYVHVSMCVCVDARGFSVTFLCIYDFLLDVRHLSVVVTFFGDDYDH